MYLWDYLSSTSLPIIVYGMGNGADKLFALCAEHGIIVSAVFASDDHARGNLFHDLPVEKYSDIRNRYPEAIILLAFGIYDPVVIARIESMADRYQVFAPDLPLFGGPLISPEYLSVHAEKISAARNLFSDEQSRFVFDTILSAKQSGSIPLLRQTETPRLNDMKLLSLTSQERFLDLGAYNGDTITEFLFLTNGAYDAITAFEPDAHNYRKLAEATASLSNITLYPYASWDHFETLTFTGKGGRNCAIKTDLPGRQPHLHPVKAIPIDSLDLAPTYIKMDVEGAEAETLHGMQETIHRSHPKLCISVYHKTDDFITLPLLLDALCPGYRMYLRHNPCLPAWELQLYAV